MSQETLTMSTMTGAARAGQSAMLKRPRWGEGIIQSILFVCGAVSIFTTLAIVFVLGEESLLFFGSEEVSLIEFVTATRWQPKIGDFGILPLMLSTLLTSFIAMLVAIPIGLSAAIFLSEYATPRTRGVLKPILEILAGVPTVVYGYFAVTFMTPLLRQIFGPEVVSVYNMAAAGLVMGVMVVPLVASMSEDALAAVPRSLREASYGLGATKLETSLRVVVPSAVSGIMAAVIVGISRAVGETMIVALAAGAGPLDLTSTPFQQLQIWLIPFQSGETMTGHVARISGGDLSYNSIDYNSIFAIGITLFIMTMALNLISRYFVNRFREVYQ